MIRITLAGYTLTIKKQENKVRVTDMVIDQSKREQELAKVESMYDLDALKAMKAIHQA